MAKNASFWSSLSPFLLSIMRIVTAFLFMQHGGMKLFGFPGSGELISVDGLMSLHGLAGILEFFGGLAVLLGLFTRPIAFILSGEMAFAYFMAHAPGGFWPIQNHGGLAIAFCFVFLYLSAAGAGPWSLDRARHRA